MDELTFTPLRLGPVQTANRLAMAPVKTAFGAPDGKVAATAEIICTAREIGN